MKDSIHVRNCLQEFSFIGHNFQASFKGCDHIPMNQSNLLIFVHCLFFFHVKAQTAVKPNTDSPLHPLHPLHPSLAAVIGILVFSCSLTFLAIAYARFCHTAPLRTQNQNFRGLNRSRSQLSGIDRTVIESIPFFRFSSLKGSKEGLECAVCISRFEDIEVLRLLPKCRHAFHLNCIDQWLASHSSCPLCRYKFDAKDLRSFTYSNSLRYSNFHNPSILAEDPNIELFVQREQDHQGSSRFSINSFRSEERGKNKESLIQADGMHKFKHKIVVSDVMIKNRWSDVNPSDLLSLNSEMLSVMSSNRFSSSGSNEARLLHNGFSIDDNMDKIKEDIERKRLYESKLSRIDGSQTISASNLPSTSFTDANSSKFFDPVQKRSRSEITNFSRFKQLSVKSRNTESSLDNGKEERIRRLWLRIARRTVQWFAGRQRSIEESDYRNQTSNV